MTTLSQDKSPSTAVHTFFLFDQLVTLLRLQLCGLTKEACNYIGNGFQSIASHFLVTTELLMSEFVLPKVFIDSDMVRNDPIPLVDSLNTHTHRYNKPS